MIIVGILLFIVLVIIHEFGHFIVARRNGVEVEEFGIGFPPRIWGRKFKKAGKTLYSVNWIPLGGFVRLKGEYSQDTRKGSFGSVSLWKKTKITMAGVGMNFLAAAVIFTILALTGMPKLVENQYSIDWDVTSTEGHIAAARVEDDSPASNAGVEAADRLISFDGVVLVEEDQLSQLTQENAGEEVNFVVLQDGEEVELSATLNEDNEEQGYFGIVPILIEEQTYGITAPLVGIGTTAQMSVLTLQGLGGLVGNLITGNFGTAADNVAGPVGIVDILSNMGAFGITYVMFFIAIISLTLAIINALPIPALDGGRLAITALFQWTKKPLSKNLEEKIHGIGFMVLILLIILVTLVDLQRIQ